MSVAGGLLTSLVFLIRLVDPTGAPIPNASVTASTRDARVRVEARSDSTGTVRLAVPSASYILHVKADGFADLVHSATFAESDSPLQLMMAIAAVTDQVVVTAAARLQTSDEVARAVSVITADTLARRGEFTLGGALAGLPGLNVQQLGGPGSFTSIKLRGLREQDTAVLIDGARFRDAGAPQGDATGFVGELYLTNVDRVEVLRGSGSSLYGTHAVGGAINLITRAGSSTPTADVAGSAGGLGFASGLAHAGAGTSRVTVSGGAGRTVTRHGVDGDDRAANTSFQARVEGRPRPAAALSLRAYFSDAESSLNESPGAIGPLPQTGWVDAVPFVSFTPSLNDADNVRDSRFVSTLAKFDHRAAERLGYSVAIHRLATRRSYRDGPLGASAFEPAVVTESDFRGTLDTVDLRADLDWHSHLTTTVGYEVEHETFFSRSVPVNRAATWSAGIAQIAHSAWIQQQWQRPDFTAAASARWQTFGLEQPVFTPAGQAPFAASDFATPPSAVTVDLSLARWFTRTGTKLRAHAGNAYRAPSMYERAGSSFGSRGYTVYGDPRLGQERSIAVDAGVDQSLGGGRVVASATWFHSRLRQVIAFGSLVSGDPFGRTSGYLMANGRRSRGFELSAHGGLNGRTRIDASYTFADAEAPANDRDGLPRASAVAAHQFSFSAHQQLRPALDLSLQVAVAGNHYLTLFDPVSFGSRAYRFDGAALTDAALTQTIRARRARITLSAVVNNLFGRQYFLQGFRTAGRTGRVRVAVGF